MSRVFLTHRWALGPLACRKVGRHPAVFGSTGSKEATT